MATTTQKSCVEWATMNQEPQSTHRVLVTGVFDVLHQEHLNFLRKAKELGGELIVAIESDVRVRQIKGEGRPVNTQDIRQQNLENLHIANRVFILPENFNNPAAYEALIAEWKPTYLAVSSHSPHLDKKREILAKFGGEVKVVHEHNPTISTTILLTKNQAPADTPGQS
jgi:D-beta-D-heptose 7-phosphate kinase / D-beta-D-heptose 1-phosphate adenosyltransferase